MFAEKTQTYYAFVLTHYDTNFTFTYILNDIFVGSIQ